MLLLKYVYLLYIVHVCMYVHVYAWQQGREGERERDFSKRRKIYWLHLSRCCCEYLEVQGILHQSSPHTLGHRKLLLTNLLLLKLRYIHTMYVIQKLNKSVPVLIWDDTFFKIPHNLWLTCIFQYDNIQEKFSCMVRDWRTSTPFCEFVYT